MSFASKALDQRVIIAISAALALAGCANKKEEPVAEADLPRRGPGMLERCAEEVGRLLALKGRL